MITYTNLITKFSRELFTSVRSKYKPLPNRRNFTVLSGDLNVKVTSIEMIKPSSPTPRHNNSVKLSIVDQFAPFVYMPMILFYQSDHNPANQSLVDHIKRSTTLKKSLSDTLVQFYPLAGRIQDNVSIDCDDHGVEFCDAYVSRDLVNVIEHPNVDEIKALLPVLDPSHENRLVLGIQLNHFTCGGTAIGLRISHKIADAVAAASFLRAWAANTARVRTTDVSPIMFNAASLFPPLEELNHISPGQGQETAMVNAGKFGSKRLIFDKKKINELKVQSDSIKNPTRVEVVTAFIWDQMMAGTTSRVDKAMHAVNFRTRMVPPIPESCFGNLSCTTSTSALTNGPKTEYPELVYNVRKAIEKIDHNYVTPMVKGDQRMVEISKEWENFELGFDKCLFTSLCRFPLNEVNFGMGEPVWACFPAFHDNNMVVLSSTKCGEGIEAWVHMLEDDINVIDFDLN